MAGARGLRLARRAVVVVLGLVLIADSLLDTFRLVEFVVGLIMVGLVPVDLLIDAVMGGPRDEGEVDRLREIMRRQDPPPA